LYKQRQELDVRVENLRHAQQTIGSLQEEVSSKLKADTNEIDYMLIRRHMLTDRKDETDKDVHAVEIEAGALRDVVSASTNSKTAAADAAELDEVASALRGSSDELQQLDSDVKRATEDGKRMDSRGKALSQERALLERQIKRLERESEHLQDRAAEADDLRTFAKAGVDGMGMQDDEDDPYMKEAAAAMEASTGWSSQKLESDAVKARAAMTGGLGGALK
jgi:chromosome segregation ATPase